tara:strand:+ start:90 stop:518 length:429 start_codon:yes stop_codon:yes gene_type:complete
MANVTTNFLPKQGQNWKLTMVPMIASVAIAEGAAIYSVGDGTHTKVTNATTNFKGIMAEAIASTDDDYATSLKLKGVYVPMNEQAEAEFSVGAGTFTTADVGKSVKFNDETGLAVDTAGIQARITGYTSSSRGACIFNTDIV